MKFLELCAGIGGFRQALENLGCECVGWSEIDKYAIKLYSAWYNDNCNFGDVTKINAETLPDFDLLVGGKPCQSDQVYSPSGVSVTLSAQNGGKGAMTGLYKIGDIDDLNTQYSRVYDSEGISATINAQGGGLGAKTGLYTIEHKVRRLTPKECFRLQGFKDEMVDLGYKLGISDTQLYKMAGNAVSVPVVEWVAQRVLNWDNLQNVDTIQNDNLLGCWDKE